MEHLTNEEIRGYIMIKDTDEESAFLLRHVNSHICKCSECAEKLRRAFSVGELAEAMMLPDFKAADAAVLSAGITPETIAKEAKSVLEREDAKEALNR